MAKRKTKARNPEIVAFEKVFEALDTLEARMRNTWEYRHAEGAVERVIQYMASRFGLEVIVDVVDDHTAARRFHIKFGRKLSQ